MYEVEIRHDGLNKYRVIKGSDLYVVNQKAEMQERAWEEMWERKQEQDAKKQERERAALKKEEKKSLAEQLTKEAVEQIETIENILKHTLDIDDKIDWDSLKDKSKFTKPKPKKVEPLKIPIEPNKSDIKYQPKLGLIDKLISSKKEQKIEASNKLYQLDYEQWENEKLKIENSNEENNNKYEEKLKKWKDAEKKFLKEQKEKNEAIETQKENYLRGVPSSIIEYCDMVLSNSNYPESFPKEYDLDYNELNKTLIVDYLLPALGQVPSLKEVKYVQTKDEFKEIHLSDSAFNKMFDDLLYQITLRTIHELYEADDINSIDSVVFNGWVKSIDKGTGKEITACILSIQTVKSEFEEINLALVDPKVCFKNLKGVGSSKLHSLAPIAPIIKINKEDERFVSSYDVAETLDESTNLAAMDWQDFEHLIRELFEKEFNQSGGEVKITQASKDGGVDAVAFDPDPIRGGKIVIQAKRYTNVVGVSAVRDLYGTVMNEGATKGILVSTADYGPDAYNFAKDKPLTLLNGNNLLHLLQKHGHKAKIDLKEAKKILSDNQ
ncbi:restriction endonuclease [Ureibacillus manganicus]|uniref:restriction endonuclease n=1 Tax=Ureibacillus manganicus TaxID=1266064 RepID=UPI00068C9ADC|nr:restriction endonuclease [Ureibacillus manganicus]